MQVNAVFAFEIACKTEEEGHIVVVRLGCDRR